VNQGALPLPDSSEDVITIPSKDSILDTVRVRPAMYMSAKSLTGLSFFLQGVEMARWGSGIDRPPEVPRRFADWVGYRLHLDSNYNGFWHHAILSRIRNEELAFDRFFELRDEFFQRRPRVVATIREDCREHQVGRYDENHQVVYQTELLPKSLRIVVYTDDPGFFLDADEDESFFYNGWFYPSLDSRHPPLSERFAPSDEVTWNRLLAENRRHKRNLSRVRARIRRKEEARKTTN